LRKKAKAQEDSDSQAEEEEKKESPQDPQVIARYRAEAAALMGAAVFSCYAAPRRVQ
jgi:hypothetical protein